MKPHQSLFAQMRDATRNLLSKGPGAASATIQQALANLRAGPKAAPAMRDLNPAPAAAHRAPPSAPIPPAAARSVPPASARATPGAAPAGTPEFVQELLASLGVQNGLNGGTLGTLGVPGFGVPPAPPSELEPGARFIAGSYANHAGSRDYKLYIPSTWHGQPMPLLVMLHGCTQNPDDFAAGTQMNAVAEEKHCFVVYPAQAKGANSSKCWNWFNALDQKRDQGEPSIIAGIARQIMAEYPVDERQVFIAGLSAGGAMAVIAGTLYPELFAAVGVHSGLPFASAQDLPSALAAMRGGAAPGTAPKNKDGGIPIIVFHGDKDTTVNPRNGEQLMAQGLHSQSGAASKASVHSGNVPNGHRYTQTTHLQPDGSPLGEHWVIHGAGHAWSGGSAHGSYTDSKGPDASREMMRFFKTVN